MRYKIVMTYDEEYKGYVIDVPELVGCMSQGKTLDGAIENIKDAIKNWSKWKLNLSKAKIRYLSLRV